MATNRITASDDTTTYDFISLRGQVETHGVAMRAFTRQGVDGVAHRQVGERCPRFALISVEHVGPGGTTAEAQVATQIGNYKGMQGTLVTVEDALGNSHSNVAVHRVDILRQRKVETAVGGSSQSGYQLVCRWLLQSTETS